jgi:hypothetical protein
MCSENQIQNGSSNNTNEIVIKNINSKLDDIDNNSNQNNIISNKEHIKLEVYDEDEQQQNEFKEANVFASSFNNNNNNNNNINAGSSNIKKIKTNIQNILNDYAETLFYTPYNNLYHTS